MNRTNNSTNNSDNNKIIAQTEYKVSNVSYSVATTVLNYSEPILTWLPDSISDKNKESISVEELAYRVNTYKKPTSGGDKINNSGFLKGIYTGYYKGENCTISAPYLCFDIDVKNTDKPDENRHLLNPAKNERIFDELKKLSVLCWRSNSGHGMAGLLYVPQIEEYTSETSINHLKVGKEITTLLSKYLHTTTGVERVVFDQAQSKFRQVRLVADQRNNVSVLNPKPFVFSYQSEVVEKQTTTGVTNYQYSDYKLPSNSIYAQFNNDNQILDVLLSNGFSIISQNGYKIRVKHNSTNSGSSGFIDKAENVYINFSDTFAPSGKIRFTPSHIVCKLQFDNNWRLFREHLYTKGYEDLPVADETLKVAAKSLKDELRGITNEADADKIIFKYCFDLKYSSYEVKRQFIEENCTLPHFRKYFEAHLNYVDYRIQYDKQLIIDKYVAEVLPEILDYTDQHNKVILRADTGKGKTTAFIRDFHKHRPNARLLILASLTIIVDQNQKEYGNEAVFLTGKSDGFDHQEARKANLVFATYEQGTKHLVQHSFDYIVIDEVHQLLTANSFKSDVIADLTALIKDTKTIGLTGTPSEIFSLLGFKLIDVDVERPNLM